MSYWFWGRPSPEQLWLDLQEVTQRIKEDHDPTIPNVRVTMFSETGEVLEEGTFDAPPGHFHSESQRTGQFARCQFSFVGFAGDVRATLVINEGPNFSGFRTLAALDAR